MVDADDALGKSRRLMLVVGAVFVAGIVSVIVVLVTRADEDLDDRVAAMPERIFDDETSVAMNLRSSLIGTDDIVRYTDSSAVLDLELDRAFVDLPDVLRSDTLELVSDGLTLYVTVPEDLQPAFPGVRWLQVETASRAEARGARLGPIPDPTSVLLALSGATEPFERVGQEELDGEPVEVVRVTIEPRLMAERMGSDHVQSANMLGSLNLEWSAEVSIGVDGRPRRIELSTELLQDGEFAGTLLLDLRLGAYSEGIQIGIPPADATQQVGSVDEALQLLQAA